MSFKDIKGQDSAISFLLSSLANNKVAQSYIFAGSGGVGKMLTAMNFAKAVNCQGDVKDKPCDACIPCKKISSSNHPDVSVVKAHKEGSSVGIDDIRELIRSISLKPYEARKKFYIIDDADSMTQEASNALLKTLEEPVSDSVVIMIVQNINFILPTIRSRSQTVKFLPLGIDEVKDFLVKAHGVDELQARLLSSFSSGSPGKALKDKDADFLEKRQRILGAIINKTFFDLEFEKASRTELKNYLDIILAWYRDVFVAKAGGVAESFFNIDKKDIIMTEAKKADFNKLEDTIRQVLSTYSFLDTNANPKLAFAVLGFKI